MTRIIAIMEPENWPPRLTRAGARMLNGITKDMRA